jgi:RNA polymerase sigma factor (sigma-70 family)
VTAKEAMARLREGAPGAEDDVVRSVAKLVMRHANKYAIRHVCREHSDPDGSAAARLDANAMADELANAGLVYFWRSLGNYDPAKGCPTTFASRAAMFAIKAEKHRIMRDRHRHHDDGRPIAPEWLAVKPLPPMPDDEAEERERREREEDLARNMLPHFLAMLDPREWEVVRGRHYCDPPKTFPEIALEVGCSKTRAQQIHAGALAKMRIAAEQEGVSL